MSVLMRPWGHQHYRIRGPQDGAAVLFLNSLGTDLRMWDGVVDQLPEIRAIGMDKRGHGLSATPAGDWTLDDLAHDALALMDHLGVGRAVVAGCSIGGMIAQAMATLAPDRVRGLFLSNTGRILFVVVMQMFAQQIASEIAGEVAPDAVDVIGAVLGVVVFDQESRALDAVIVALTFLQAAGPGESDVVHPGLLNLGEALGGEVGFHVVEIDVQQREQGFQQCEALCWAADPRGSAQARAVQGARLHGAGSGQVRAAGPMAGRSSLGRPVWLTTTARRNRGQARWQNSKVTVAAAPGRGWKAA